MSSTHETLRASAPAADVPDDLDAIVAELERTNRAVAALVARIDDADDELLDDLTEQIVTVLARVEQLRCARAWWHAAQQRDEARWADYLDVA